jgi:hypothetical protein
MGLTEITAANGQPDVNALGEESDGGRVARWLLMASDGPSAARESWTQYGVTLLECGVLFCAVRLDPPLVYAAAGTEEREDVIEYVREILRGPTFLDSTRDRYYALVPKNTKPNQTWAVREQCPHVQFLGRGTFLGVPNPLLTKPGAWPCWWITPPEMDADLCSPRRVSQLENDGRMRLVQASGPAEVRA